MFRTVLAAAGMLLVGLCAHAQRAPRPALPAPGVKSAGTYHLATGTWTRGAAGARAWNDVIFDNTCTVGFYSPHVPTQRYVDDGRVPSTTSPTNPGPPTSAISWTGTQDSYTICSFQIGYCTFTPFPTYEVSFWECFTGCQDATLLSPIATFQLTSLPGAGTSGLSCWTVNVDLVNSGLEFELTADCDGVWSGGGAPDTFGWSGQHLSPSTAGTPGPLIKGDPLGYLNGGPSSSGCDVGAHTIFYTGSDLTNTEGTGLDGLDQWEVDDMTPTPTLFLCYWFGGYDNGNLYGSFHMQLGTGCGHHGPPGFAYCPGDGIAPHTPCPYLNNNDGSTSPAGGCDWGNPAFPTGGILDAYGTSIWSDPNLLLVATAVESDFGIFFGANNATNGGNGNPLNDGLRCAGGALLRLSPPTMASGNMASLGPIELLDSGAGPGITRRYQYWFRTPNGPGGTMANLTNGYEISWQ